MDIQAHTTFWEPEPKIIKKMEFSVFIQPTYKHPTQFACQNARIKNVYAKIVDAIYVSIIFSFKIVVK